MPAMIQERARCWSERTWDKLLAYVEERQVVPIVGPELLQVEVGGARTSLEGFLAERLAQELALPLDGQSKPTTLNAVACQFLSDPRNDRADLYLTISALLDKTPLPSPGPLLQLARIDAFNLFVCTTFDPLLEEALNHVRFGGHQGTVVYAYSPKKPSEDLPRPKGELTRPVVFHLFGRRSASPSYVLCEEDMLEFVCRLQEGPRPEKLFDELERNNLLVLGCNFADWLARFFLRTAKRDSLSKSRLPYEYLADQAMGGDENLVLFLQRFSSHTEIYQGGGAVEFVAELCRRWEQRHPRPAAAPQVPPPVAMPPGAVFISYARQDLDAVWRLKARLESAGLPVWFDFDQLLPGCDFRAVIEENIKNCSCFVPVLSRHTEARGEGFFRREWSCAVDREKGMFPDPPFLFPVVADDTKTFSRVPPRFLEMNVTWLTGPDTETSLVAALTKAVEQRRPARK
jgi:hypothetical protein